MDFGFVKLGVVTPQIKVADVEFNTESVIREMENAQKAGVELLVFPELCLTGYTCGDLFYSDVLLNGAMVGIDKVRKATEGKDMLVFIGAPIKSNGLIYNCSVALNCGKVLGVTPKTYLPNYNEFYEKRQFAPANLSKEKDIEVCGQSVPFGTDIIYSEKDNLSFKVAAEICEDLWSPIPPSVYYAYNGATAIVNLSASNETVGKAEYRRQLCSAHSGRIVCAYAYADAGNGESTTDLVFAGHNLICENGVVLCESELFSNTLKIADVDLAFIESERAKHFNQDFKSGVECRTVKFSANNKAAKLERLFSKTPFVPNEDDELNSRADLIINIQAEALKKRIEHTNAKSVVIGLSGGLDSTLALLVSVSAMKKIKRNLKDIIAVTMPCFGTTSRTYLNTLKLAKSMGVTLKKVDISKSVTRHLKDIRHKDGELDVTFENAQARERTQVLMDIANMTGGMVVGTGDLSELALGWATYNGDHMSMYGVNSSVPKTLVRHLVKFYADKSRGKLKATLYDILDTPVSPELLPAKDGEISQKTEDIVGPYVLHDFFLYYFIRRGYSPKKIFYIAKQTFKGEFDQETILKWLKIFYRRFFIQQFKRSCVPDGIKVGSVALSPRGDWRMPSDAVSKLWLNELESM